VYKSQTKYNQKGLTMEKKQKWGLVIPTEVTVALKDLRDNKHTEMFADYVALLREEGWSLASIADPQGMTRERIRQIANSCKSLELAQAFADARGWVVPRVPKLEAKYLRKTPLPLKPSEETIARLLALKPVASSVRWTSNKGRAEAEEYVSIIAGEIKRGVSVYMVAKVLGVTPLAIRSRLSRYGHLPPTTGGSETYQAMFAPAKHRA